MPRKGKRSAPAPTTPSKRQKLKTESSTQGMGENKPSVPDSGAAATSVLNLTQDSKPSDSGAAATSVPNLTQDSKPSDSGATAASDPNLTQDSKPSDSGTTAASDPNLTQDSKPSDSGTTAASDPNLTQDRKPSDSGAATTSDPNLTQDSKPSDSGTTAASDPNLTQDSKPSDSEATSRENNMLSVTNPHRDPPPPLNDEVSNWLIRYLMKVDECRNSSRTDKVIGAFKKLKGEIAYTSGVLAKSPDSEESHGGLAPWKELSNSTRDRINGWSPIARQLFESEDETRRAMVVERWMWHFFEDNLFFSTMGGEGEPMTCSDGIWGAFQTLNKEFVSLTATGDYAVRHRYYFWRRLTNNLLRNELGLDSFAKLGDLVPLLRKWLRLILALGENALPDPESDIRLSSPGSHFDMILRDAVMNVLRFNWLASLSKLDFEVMFLPPHTEESSGFEFDKESADAKWTMIRNDFPDKAVQFIMSPMLVSSGHKERVYGEDRKVDVRMRVLATLPRDHGTSEGGRCDPKIQDACNNQKAKEGTGEKSLDGDVDPGAAGHV